MRNQYLYKTDSSGKVWPRYLIHEYEREMRERERERGKAQENDVGKPEHGNKQTVQCYETNARKKKYSVLVLPVQL